MLIREYYDKWMLDKNDSTLLVETCKKLKSAKTKELTADLAIDVQKSFEMYVFRKIHFNDIFKLYNIKEDSALYSSKQKFYKLMENHMKNHTSIYKAFFDLSIKIDHFFVIFYISLINTIATTYEAKPAPYKFKTAVLRFKIEKILRDVLEHKIVLATGDILNKTKELQVNSNAVLLKEAHNLVNAMSIELIKIGKDAKFIDEAKRENEGVKTIDYLKINDNIDALILEHAIREHIRLPMLSPPIEYFKKSENKYVGGYLLAVDNTWNKEMNLVLTERGTVLVIDSIHLEQINYLMSTPLTISSEYVKRILDLDENVVRDTVDLSVLKFKSDYNNNQKVYEAKRFLFTLFLADAFSGLIIYLNWGFDGRGRFYNTNAPLCFQGNPIIRNLFILKTEEILKEESLSLTKYRTLNTFEKLNYDINGSNSLVGIDATNSAYQIIGGLLRNEKIMELTNIVGNKKGDLYVYILLEFKKNLDFNKIEELYAIYEEKSKTKASYYYNTQSWEIFRTIIEKIDRKIIKKPIMTLAYNQTILSASDELQKTLLGSINKDLTWVFNNIIRTLHYTILKQFVEFEIFQKSLRLLIHNAFKIQQENPNPHIKASADSHSFMQNYEIFETKPYSFRSKFTQKTHKIYEWTNNHKIDMLKNKIAFLPNFVHFLDSCIAIDVVKKCKEQKIAILTVHDCFYTKPEYLTNVRSFYRESYIKIVLKENLLENLFKNNNVDMLKECPALFNILAESKIKIEELIKKCTNDNILC